MKNRIIILLIILLLLCGCSYKKIDDTLHRKVDQVKENPAVLFEDSDVKTLEEAEEKAEETHKDVEYVDPDTGEQVTVEAPHRIEEGNHISKGEYAEDPQSIFPKTYYRVDSITIYDKLSDSPITEAELFDGFYYESYEFILIDLSVKYEGDKDTEDGIVSDIWLASEEIENTAIPESEAAYFHADGYEVKDEHDGYFMPLYQNGDACTVQIGFFCPQEYVDEEKVWLILHGENETEDVYFDLF